MAFVLHYSKGVYQNKINEIENFIKRLDDHLVTLRDYRSQIGNFWDDENARQAGKDLDILIRQVTNAQERARDMLGVYNKIVQDLDNANQSTLGLLGEAGDILGALGI